MTPKKVMQIWIDLFKTGDADKISELYHKYPR